MVNQEDVKRQLGILSRIQGLSTVTPDLENMIQETRFTESGEEIQRRLDVIQELATTGFSQGHSSMWHDLEFTLSVEEYVLPPELEKVHPLVVRDITAGKSISNLSTGGLLLHGSAVGTGKSEYIQFLASQVPDGIHVAVINLDRIVGNPNPGTALRTLYLDLNEIAREEGVMYIAFLDEFERMVTKHSTLHSAITDQTSDHSSAKRANVQHRRETRETLELDDVGAQTFATFKTLISGGENVQFVYTVATSNQSSYEDALLRRLQAVELGPFGMPTFSIDRESVPDYSFYGVAIPRVLKILQAAYYRDNKNRSEHIDRLYGEVVEVLDGLAREYTVDSSKVKPFQVGGFMSSSRCTERAQKAERNNGYLDGLLRYFGFDLGTFARGSERVKFAGHFNAPIIQDGREDNIQLVNMMFDNTTIEHSTMLQLVPDRIAKVYTDNPTQFRAYEGAKKALQKLIFPQLP